MTPTNASRRADAMRSAILAGARRLFLAEGFERTSMDAVAAAIGVSKMTVYRHFRSKEALFAGIVGEMCDRIADPELAREMARLPLREALETFGRRSLDTIFDPETLGLHRVVIAESGRFPELGRMFYERGPGINVSTLAAYLAGHEAARLKPAEAARLAGEFMSLLRGYEHMRALLGLDGPPPRAQRERQVARAADHVMRNLT
ncbi:MAG: TetR/AcrR family transcriptional regulator [Rhodospirillaceae bacterium]|nr:TetR/AcrR family transcriptional regulator [Rhodospirillaceae bacterium]